MAGEVSLAPARNGSRGGFLFPSSVEVVVVDRRAHRAEAVDAVAVVVRSASNARSTQRGSSVECSRSHRTTPRAWSGESEPGRENSRLTALPIGSGRYVERNRPPSEMSPERPEKNWESDARLIPRRRPRRAPRRAAPRRPRRAPPRSRARRGRPHRPPRRPRARPGARQRRRRRPPRRQRAEERRRPRALARPGVSFRTRGVRGPGSRAASSSSSPFVPLPTLASCSSDTARSRLLIR